MSERESPIADGPREALNEGLDRAQRNIEYHQRDLLKKIEAEKRAHQAVEEEKRLLNAEVEKRVAIEDAIRRLSI